MTVRPSTGQTGLWKKLPGGYSSTAPIIRFFQRRVKSFFGNILGKNRAGNPFGGDKNERSLEGLYLFCIFSRHWKARNGTKLQYIMVVLRIYCENVII